MEVNDSDFQEKVIQASKEKLVAVDFWAPWCGPCRMLAPHIEKAVESVKEKAILAKVNVDENPAIAHKYGVMSIPTVKFFKDGEIVNEFVGVRTEEQIKEIMKKLI
ncbi:thioredoxin [Candidatus Woesearchaeota archaeon]|nr:MAG: thioredoxin [Candidatus Woesearchaeota archaeon]